MIAAACLISLIGFGIRASFGLYLEPMTVANGWSRETFSLAMAIQNLLWGIGVPVAGAIADRFGTAKVVALGAAVYSVGIAGMAMSDSGLALHLTGGILVGLGVAFCSFSLVLAAIARLIGPGRRSLALGLGTAAGSLGQVIFSPINQALISRYGWYDSLLVMSVVSLVLIPLAFSLRGSSESRGEPASDQGLTNALGEAANHRSYLLLTAGFFVCGFHVAFITVHFPTYVTDLGLSAQTGAYALSLIGPVQHYWFSGVRSVRATILQEDGAVLHLFHPGADHPGTSDGPGQRADNLSICGINGTTLAVNRAFDHGDSGADIRAQVHGHPVWPCFPEPSGRGVLLECGWVGCSTTAQALMTLCGGRESALGCSQP